MSEGVVERVARAMHSASPYRLAWGTGRQAWEADREHTREFFRAMARAAIAALREPTEAMLQEAVGAGWHGGVEGYTRGEMEHGANLWRAMIDVALKGPTT